MFDDESRCVKQQTPGRQSRSLGYSIDLFLTFQHKDTSNDETGRFRYSRLCVREKHDFDALEIFCSIRFPPSSERIVVASHFSSHQPARVYMYLMMYLCTCCDLGPRCIPYGRATPNNGTNTR